MTFSRDFQNESLQNKIEADTHRILKKNEKTLNKISDSESE